jgi:hypothetical protein
MPDTRKSSDRPRQMSFRLGDRVKQQIDELCEALWEDDSLHRPVSGADVLRIAIDELHQRYCRSVRGRKLLANARRRMAGQPVE